MCKQIENTSRRHQTIARQNAEYAYNNRRWTYGDIFEAYSKPSTAKVRAWEYCKQLCKEVNGHDIIISARGCQTFSVCFKFEDNGRPCYAYITRDYDRYCYA